MSSKHKDGYKQRLRERQGIRFVNVPICGEQDTHLEVGMPIPIPQEPIQDKPAQEVEAPAWHMRPSRQALAAMQRIAVASATELS